MSTRISLCCNDDGGGFLGSAERIDFERDGIHILSLESHFYPSRRIRTQFYGAFKHRVPMSPHENPVPRWVKIGRVWLKLS